MTMTTIKMQTTVFRALLRATALAASKDKTRPHLACVRLMVRDGRIIADATDGHRLHRASAPWRAFEDGEVPPEGVAILIPQASLAACLKAVPAPKRGQAPAMAVVTATGLETDSAAVRWSAVVEGALFPAVERVIPPLREKAQKFERENCASGWGIAPQYLIEACEACSAALDGDRGGVIVQTPETSLDPARIHATGYIDGSMLVEVVCVVMPMRL